MAAQGSRGAVRGWDSGCILNVEPVAFPDHLDVEDERKRGVEVQSLGLGDWKEGVVLSWAGKCSKGKLSEATVGFRPPLLEPFTRPYTTSAGARVLRVQGDAGLGVASISVMRKADGSQPSPREPVQQKEVVNRAK